MNYSNMHPAEQVASVMSGIYKMGRTTTSGGNISMIDDEGRLWMTPTSIDKSSLRPEDIACADRSLIYLTHPPRPLREQARQIFQP